MQWFNGGRWATGWGLFSAFVGLCSFQSLTKAAEIAHHPVVPGFERLIDAEETDQAALGRVLLGELNCTSCHKTNADWKELILRKPAPTLDEVGNRVRPEWIRQYLANPHAVKPGSTMPNVLGGLSEEKRLEAVDVLTHFLASTGNLNDTIADRLAAQRGYNLFQKVGCVACHQSLDKKSEVLATSVPLPDLGAKYSLESLVNFLKEPHKARGGGRMPGFQLKDEEYRDIASSFLRGAVVAPNVNYAVYYGAWETLPNFAAMKPEKTGTSAGLDIGVAGKTDNFGIRFTAFLRVTKAGEYKFWTASDDGSRVTVGDKVVVEHDGVHPPGDKTGTITLQPGMHPVTIDYFEASGGEELRVELQTSGLNRQSLDGHLFLTAESAAVDMKGGKQPGPPGHPASFSADPEKVKKGKELFGSLGCASCHTMKHEGQTIPSDLKAPELAKLAEPARLSAASGCLAEKVPAKVPVYGLNAKQRKAIVTALQKRPAGPQLSQPEIIHQTLTSFNCYACHVRGEIGGVEEGRNDLFTTTIKEMGDEARIPPHLTGVGDKLKTDWIKKVMNDGAIDRAGYMHIRMPKFGNGNVGPLAEAFAAVDQKTEATLPKWDDTPEYTIKAEGRKLVGAQALSCIKCHDFGPHPSTGIRAINLQTMTQRLREDWFHRYVVDPQEYRRGTRMPTSWPFGKAANKEIFEGDPPKQIAAIWIYLSDGSKAQVPAGLVREPIELIATTEPVIYRNFIEGAGSRAIGVGYPEQANLAFDANDMRLALIWHGQFIDASRHWNGRGVGYEGPLGDHLIPLPTGVPFASLISPNDPWPTGLARESGFHFLGYRLNENRQPIFRYRDGVVTVDDAIAPVKIPGQKYPHLRRTMKFTPTSAAKFSFRAAVSGKIEDLGNNSYRVDGNWVLKLTGADAATIRDSGGKKELLIPLNLTAQPVTLVLDYAW